jgi:hypothetical protein
MRLVADKLARASVVWCQRAGLRELLDTPAADRFARKREEPSQRRAVALQMARRTCGPDLLRVDWDGLWS